jgi:hypothetical protein
MGCWVVGLLYMTQKELDPGGEEDRGRKKRGTGGGVPAREDKARGGNCGGVSRSSTIPGERRRSTAVQLFKSTRTRGKEAAGRPRAYGMEWICGCCHSAAQVGCMILCGQMYDDHMLQCTVHVILNSRFFHSFLFRIQSKARNFTSDSLPFLSCSVICYGVVFSIFL